jgi:hypothetical protein
LLIVGFVASWVKFEECNSGLMNVHAPSDGPYLWFDNHSWQRHATVNITSGATTLEEANCSFEFMGTCTIGVQPWCRGAQLSPMPKVVAVERHAALEASSRHGPRRDQRWVGRCPMSKAKRRREPNRGHDCKSTDVLINGLEIPDQRHQ